MALGLKHAFDVGSELNILSNATGTAVKDLVVFQRAFTMNGIEADKVGPAVGRMRKQIVAAAGGGGAEATFARLHMSVKQLGKMDAAGQMQAIGAAIMKVQNPTERSAAAMALFGRNGQQMMALFGNKGAMAEAAEAVGAKAEILDKNSAIFHDITVKLETIGSKLQGFFLGMAERVAPVLKPLLDGLSHLNFTGLGEQIGDVVAFIMQAFSSGQLGTIIGRSIQISLTNAANAVMGVLVGAAYAFGQLIVEAIKNGVLVFQIVTKADFWKGLGDALLGAAQNFVALLLDGVAMILEKMKSIPGLGKKLGHAAESVRSEAAAWRRKGNANEDRGADLLGPTIDKIKQRFMDELQNVGAAFQKGQSVAPRFDTSEAQASMDKAIDTVFKAVQKNQESADKFNAENKPGQQGAVPDMEETRRFKIGPAFASTLMKIGGGGTSVGSTSKDPVLEENRRHTSLLQTIAKNTALKTGGLTTGHLATFAL